MKYFPIIGSLRNVDAYLLVFSKYEVINKWDYDPKVIELAIRESILNNAKTIKYMDRVLFNWEQNGIKTEEDAKRYIEEFSNKVKPKKKKETKVENYYKEL